MILVLSEHSDISTNMVIDWLLYYKVAYHRVNSSDFFYRHNNYNISISNVYSEGSLYSNIEKIWLRRWFELDINYELEEIENIEQNTFIRKIHSFSISELISLSDFFFYILRNKKWLTNPQTFFINKLITLSIAQEIGINIPETLITKDNNQCLIFQQEYGKIITKPMSEIDFFTVNSELYGLYTSLYPYKNYNISCMTLFQECLEKEFEIRIFYLDKKFYSIAIFSQFDENTLIDMRIPASKKNIRMVPYVLPQEITDKLQKLLNHIKIQMCTIDMIKTITKKYYYHLFFDNKPHILLSANQKQ